jgi:hypothetical protein
MTPSTWKTTWLFALLLALLTPHLSAQQPLQVWTGTGVDFEFRADGSIVEEGGTNLNLLSTTDLQSSSRFIWYPALSALRAGEGCRETVANIGLDSVAFGLTEASGQGAIAAGEDCSANGYGATALGFGNSATNSGATAIGSYCFAIGNSALALGNNSWATGNYSVALGGVTVGDYSTAIGENVFAPCAYSVAIGRWNLGYIQFGGPPSASTTTWISTDPLFEIGNGTQSHPSDALIVYKNGNAVLSGTLTVAPGGDIPMFTGGN